MKRVQLLEKLHMNVPESATISLIIDTDAKNEADDQYAIIHHLLHLKVSGLLLKKLGNLMKINFILR